MTSFAVTMTYAFTVVAKDRRAAMKFVQDSIEQGAISLNDMTIEVKRSDGAAS